MDARMFGSIVVKTRDYKFLRPIFDGMINKGPAPDAFIYQHMIMNAPVRATKLSLLNQMRAASFEPDRRMWIHLAAANIYPDDVD